MRTPRARTGIVDAVTSAGTVARDSIRVFFTRATVVGLTVLTGIVIAKSLGPVGKGEYSGVQLLVSITVCAPAGIATSITYFLTKQQRRLSELLPSLGLLLTGVCLAAWLCAGAWSIVRGFTMPLAIFAAVLPAAIALSWQGSLYVGLGSLRNLNAQDLGLALATFVAVAVAVRVLHLGAVGALVAWALCLYLVAAVFIVHVLHVGRGTCTNPGAMLRELVRYGGLSSFNPLLGLLNYRIDSIILFGLLGTSAFGIYTMAVNFGELLFMLSRPVATAASHDIGSREAPAAASITAKVVRVCTATVCVAALAAFFVGPPVISAVYGPRFASAATPLRILLPGIVAFSTAGTFAAFFLFQLGRPMIVAANNVTMIALQAAACFLLVPHFGQAGAATASTATYLAGALVNTWWFCRATGVSFADVWVVRPDDIRSIYLATAGRIAGSLNPRLRGA